MTEGRGRGWAAVGGLALVAMGFSVVTPALLIFVPLGLLFIALPPRRPLMLAFAVFVGWLAFSAPPTGTFWYFERGWALLVGAWFVAATALLPERSFLTRGLVALAGAVLSAAALLGSSPAGFAELDATVAGRLREQAELLLVTLSESPRMAEFFRAQSEAALGMTARLFPALLALASLAALGIAWWAFGRVGQGLGRPIGAVREFRFSNELVWLLIAGLVLLLLPPGGLTGRVGENLLMFMAALYALRGVGVLLMLAGVGWPVAVLIGAVLMLLLAKLVMAATILVGLSDTWLDLRARREAPSSPGS